MKRRKIIAGIISGSLILTSATVFLESSNIALAKRQNGRTKKIVNTEKVNEENSSEIQDRAFPLVAALAVFSAAYGLDLGYFKPDRDQWNRVNNTYNGWVKLNDWNGKTLWFYKVNGAYKHGWHWDDYYKGWYYFYRVEFVVGNQTFSKIRWNANVMYDAAYNNSWMFLNNKWYEFQVGGKLIEHSGWRKYNGKWLYHLPGDYGAIANQSRYIDGKWYTFDSNGYWV